MRAALRLSGQTVRVLIAMAALAMVLGMLAAIYMQSLRTGLVVAGTAFVAGGSGFAYSLWLLWRPGSDTPLHI